VTGGSEAAAEPRMAGADAKAVAFFARMQKTRAAPGTLCATHRAGTDSEETVSTDAESSR